MVHHTGVKHQVAYVLLIFLSNGAHTTALKDDPPLLVIKTPGNIDILIHFFDTSSSVYTPLDATHARSDIPNGTGKVLATPTTAKLIRKQAKTHAAVR